MEHINWLCCSLHQYLIISHFTCISFSSFVLFFFFFSGNAVLQLHTDVFCFHFFAALSLCCCVSLFVPCGVCLSGNKRITYLLSLSDTVNELSKLSVQPDAPHVGYIRTKGRNRCCNWRSASYQTMTRWPLSAAESFYNTIAICRLSGSFPRGPPRHGVERGRPTHGSDCKAGQRSNCNSDALHQSLSARLVHRTVLDWTLSTTARPRQFTRRQYQSL